MSKESDLYSKLRPVLDDALVWLFHIILRCSRLHLESNVPIGDLILVSQGDQSLVLPSSVLKLKHRIRWFDLDNRPIGMI